MLSGLLSSQSMPECGGLQMTCFSFIAPLVLAELSAGREPACASPSVLLRPPLKASKGLVLC